MPKMIDTPMNDERDRDEKKKKKGKIAFCNLSSSIWYGANVGSMEAKQRPRLAAIHCCIIIS